MFGSGNQARCLSMENAQRPTPAGRKASLIRGAPPLNAREASAFFGPALDLQVVHAALGASVALSFLLSAAVPAVKAVVLSFLLSAGDRIRRRAVSPIFDSLRRTGRGGRCVVHEGARTFPGPDEPAPCSPRRRDRPCGGRGTRVDASLLRSQMGACPAGERRGRRRAAWAPASGVGAGERRGRRRCLDSDGHGKIADLAVGIRHLIADVVGAGVCLSGLIEHHLGGHFDFWAARNLLGRKYGWTNCQDTRPLGPG
jgi:hypothetical protein